MTSFYREKDADLAAVAGQNVAVVGYGNQGRSRALNLRDSGLDPRVCVRDDETRRCAEADGFSVSDIDAAQLKEQHVGELVGAMEDDLLGKLGPRAKPVD